MLSDYLLNSLSEIEQYQRENPDEGFDDFEWLDSVKAAIEDLAIHLVTRPDNVLPELEEVEGKLGHYTSRYGFGVIRCTVHRNLKTTHEARTDLARFSWRMTSTKQFKTSTEGLAREAVQMASILRQRLADNKSTQRKPMGDVHQPPAIHGPLGKWNIVRKLADGRWELVERRNTMKAIKSCRKNIMERFTVTDLRTCDVDGNLYMASGWGDQYTQCPLVPDEDMFDDKPSERVRL